MIKKIISKKLKLYFQKGDASRLPAADMDKIQTILYLLETCTSVEQLNLPGFNLHPLKGTYAGFWAVTVRANWRIVFRFENEEATDIDYIDYH